MAIGDAIDEAPLLIDCDICVCPGIVTFKSFQLEVRDVVVVVLARNAVGYLFLTGRGIEAIVRVSDVAACTPRHVELEAVGKLNRNIASAAIITEGAVVDMGSVGGLRRVERVAVTGEGNSCCVVSLLDVRDGVGHCLCRGCGPRTLRHAREQQ